MAEQKIIDIEPKYLKMVQSIFARNLPFKQVWAFGSRVKFTARPSSDLDCAVFGATDNEIAKTQEAFDESEVPFEVQLLNWESIPEDFKENIKKEYFVLRKESDWGEFRLCEFADEVRDSYQPKDKDDYIYIGLEHIEQQELRFNGQGHSSEIQSTKRFFQKGDILFGSLRPYFRKVVRPKFFGVCSTDITVIRSNPKNAEQGFLYYLIANKQFIDHASNIANGSRMPRASWKVLESSNWLIPPLQTQRKIAAILSAYDDLIENNNKRIKILEEMAQTLYKEWFVNFKFPNHQNTKFVDSELGKIPEGWEVGKISDCCLKIQNGGTPKRSKSEYWENATIPWLSSGEVRENIIIGTKEFISELGLKESSAKLLPKYTTIVALYGATAGQVAFLAMELSTNQAVCALFPRENHRYFNYLLLQSISDDLIGKATGAAQQNISKDIIEKMKIIIPDTKVLRLFEEIMIPIFKLWEFLSLKTQNLRQTRDLLLPRLISGEISVENLEVKINDEA